MVSYPSLASKCDASIIVTRLHDVSAGGVTFSQLLPPSVVRCISPSSVPIQSRSACRSPAAPGGPLPPAPAPVGCQVPPPVVGADPGPVGLQGPRRDRVDDAALAVAV